MKRALSLLIGLALFATACGSSATDTAVTADSGSASEAAQQAPIGDPLPDFTATTVSGGQIVSNDLEGTDTVLWFWAPW